MLLCKDSISGLFGDFSFLIVFFESSVPSFLLTDISSIVDVSYETISESTMDIPSPHVSSALNFDSSFFPFTSSFIVIPIQKMLNLDNKVVMNEDLGLTKTW